jgi:hypothetical protein
MTIRLCEGEMMQYGIKAGEVYAVAERHNLLTDEKSYIFKDPETGFGGNMNSHIKRYHGWRGTTNDKSTEAIGVREVLSVTVQKNGLCRVKLSDDLHPDWE